MIIPLLSIVPTSCSDSEDEPNQDSSSSSKEEEEEAYTFSQTQNFSKKLMVESIKRDGYDSYIFEYDAKNQPIIISPNAYAHYQYDGSTCTFSTRYDTFKGYFDGNKLIKAEWSYHTITNVTYEGEHLVKGSNGYRLTWNADGNITDYSAWGMKFTYTEIPNKANIDFNMIIIPDLAECWCDDGSKYFTIFGWTGARTANLISTRHDRDGDQYEFSYNIDELGRPIEIDAVTYTDKGNRFDHKYTITYIEP